MYRQQKKVLSLNIHSAFEHLTKPRNAVLVAVISTFCLVNTYAEGPAVSQVNAKLEGVGGVLDGEGTGIGAASVAAPLGHSFGLQVDGLVGETDGRGLAGYGAHLFWRDPEQGFLGGVVSRIGRSGNYINRYGAEGEYYFEQLTLGAGGGKQTGFLGGTWHANLGAKYYVNDNLMFNISGQGFSDTRVGQIGVEWQPDVAIDGLSVFAVGGVGSDDLDFAFGGVRWYFGGLDKSLKLRHREDDPVNPLIGGIAGLNNAIVKEILRQRELRGDPLFCASPPTCELGEIFNPTTCACDLLVNGSP